MPIKVKYPNPNPDKTFFNYSQQIQHRLFIQNMCYRYPITLYFLVHLYCDRS